MSVTPKITPVKSGPSAHAYSYNTRAPMQSAPGRISPCKSPQIRAIAVTAGLKGYGRIPLRPDSAASFPRKKIAVYLPKNTVNLSKFIQLHGNYYLHFTPSASRPGGPPDFGGQRPFRRLKNRRPTDGLSSILHRCEKPVTANAESNPTEEGLLKKSYPPHPE